MFCDGGGLKVWQDVAIFAQSLVLLLVLTRGLQQDPVSGSLSIHNMLPGFPTYFKCLAFMFPGQGSHVG